MRKLEVPPCPELVDPPEVENSQPYLDYRSFRSKGRGASRQSPNSDCYYVIEPPVAAN